MSQVHDPDNAYWAAFRKHPAFIRAWNAALWEAAQIVMDARTREQALADLRERALR